jgi:hypothetical protein
MLLELPSSDASARILVEQQTVKMIQLSAIRSVISQITLVSIIVTPQDLAGRIQRAVDDGDTF